MAVPFLILDGYNVMHAAGITRSRYGPGDLDRCRQRLNKRLIALLSRDVLERATIVYDAFDSPSDDERLQDCGGLTVLFAPRGSDADTQIERMLRTHSAPRQVVVVSSDHRLHKAARRRKAGCVDSEEFLAALEIEGAVRPGIVSPVTPPGSAAVSETDSNGRSLPHELPRPKKISVEDTGSHGFDRDYLDQIRAELENGELD